MAQVVIDAKELISRALKYIAEGLMVAIASLVLPKKKLDLEEVVMLACVAASTFALLDIFGQHTHGGSKVADSARMGVGLGLGANMVGFPMK